MTSTKQDKKKTEAFNDLIQKKMSENVINTKKWKKDRDDLKSFVEEIKKDFEDHHDHSGDILVSASADFLKSPFLGKNAENKFSFIYNWLQEREPDTTDCKKIEKGTILDRVGDEKGNYMCPVNNGRIYTVSERAIPYYFLETDISYEPSYHQYIVTKDITKEELLKEIKNCNNENIIKNNNVREYLIDCAEAKNIIRRTVVPIPTFEDQGQGNGEEVCLPVSVKVLVGLEFLKIYDDK